MISPESSYYDICIIIRSSGERTGSLCMELVKKQGYPQENITVIKEAPFSRSLQKSFEAGIDFNYTWTLCLDADVLLRGNSIHEMVKFARALPINFFEIQGLVLDKFFGGARQAGFHLYRTKLLNRAIQYIPVEKEQLRPEHYTIDAMRKAGFPWKRVDYLVGLHDFEQYYQDIYRKSFIQARKHQEYAEIILSFWPEQASKDSDFEIAWKGFLDGLSYEGEVRIDYQQEVYQVGFEKFGIQEKPILLPDHFDVEDIQGIMDKWAEPPVYHKYFQYEIVSKAGEKQKHLIRGKIFKEKRNELSTCKYWIFILGWTLERIGDRLMKHGGDISPGKDFHK